MSRKQKRKKAKTLDEDPEAFFLQLDKDLSPAQEDVQIDDPYRIDSEIAAREGADIEAYEYSQKKSRLRRKKKVYKIDLHGLTLEEAKTHIEMDVEQLKRRSNAFSLRIITGKGHHSGPEGGILFREIYPYVLQQFKGHIVRIDTSPEQTLIQGFPLRGHFDLDLKF